MTARDLQGALREIGWPIAVDGDVGPLTREATADFQRGFAIEGHSYSRLPVTGEADKHTIDALKWSFRNDGKASAHFAFREFASGGDRWIKISRSLVRGLEAYRKQVGHGVAVVSGYRDPQHNHDVGGAANSQHKFGNAADLFPELTVAQVRSLRKFSGIGYQGATGLVRHVDVRHVGPNTTNGSVAEPTIWMYS